MRRIVMCAPSVMATILVLATVAISQPTGNVAEQSNQQYLAWIDAVAEFTKDVRFDENDVRSLLDHWGDFDKLGGVSEEDDPDDEDELLDFDALMSREEYRDWAKSNNLDPDEWIRKSMRIVAVLMREQILQGAERSAEALPEQLKMIEMQRDQIGEEMYEEMKTAMQLGADMVKGTARAAGTMPEPTESEEAILEAHRDELDSLLSADEGDEYDEEGEEEGW